MISQYVRKGKKIVGILVAYKEEAEVRIGWACYNYKARKEGNETLPFNKSFCTVIAVGRADAKTSFEYMPVSFVKSMEAFVGRCRRYFRVESIPQTDCYWAKKGLEKIKKEMEKKEERMEEILEELNHA